MQIVLLSFVVSVTLGRESEHILEGAVGLADAHGLDHMRSTCQAQQCVLILFNVVLLVTQYLHVCIQLAGTSAVLWCCPCF